MLTINLKTVADSFGVPMEDLHENVQAGVWLMAYLVVPTLLLETWSHETSRALHKKNAHLYWQAFALNFVNHFGLGAPAYALAVTLLAQPEEEFKVRTTVGQVFGLVVVHSICFFQAHQAFHTVKPLYRWHKFHHLFNTHVTPITANAVSMVEYVIAYLTPFGVGMLLFPCSALALQIAIQLISICNIAMHTPKLELLYKTYVPAWLPIVGTAAHLEHHKRLNCHYAAPTIDWDTILATLQRALKGDTKDETKPIQVALGS